MMKLPGQHPSKGGTDTDTPTRRRVLHGLATAGLLGLAGCVGGDDSDSGNGNGDDTADGNGDDGDGVSDVAPELRLNGRALTDTFPLSLIAADSGETVGEVQWHETYSHWHFEPLEVPLDGWLTVRVEVLDHNLEEIPVGDDETYQVAVETTDDTPPDLLQVDLSDDVVSIRGTEQGQGGLLFSVMEGETEHWTSPPLVVEVSE